MRQVRNYHNHGFDEVAEQIREDVMRQGYSEGWAGDVGTLRELMDRLYMEGIRYTDDMRGRWERQAA